MSSLTGAQQPEGWADLAAPHQALAQGPARQLGRRAAGGRERVRALIVMLGGGDKSTQQADINQAIELAKSLED